ncbi:hypothetical protein [Caudoviricetes sp.]|nr:hypothetical protein [Caudoviricetes sp.]
MKNYTMSFFENVIMTINFSTEIEAISSETETYPDIESFMVKCSEGFEASITAYDAGILTAMVTGTQSDKSGTLEVIMRLGGKTVTKKASLYCDNDSFSSSERYAPIHTHP